MVTSGRAGSPTRTCPSRSTSASWAEAGAELRGAPGGERRAGGRLAQDRHPRQQGARRFLAGAPGREVERVDVHRHAVPRDPEVETCVPRGAAELDRISVAQRAQRPELPAELRVVRERGDGAVDVELGVAARVAAVLHGEGDELVAAGVQRLAPGPEQRSALSEGQLAQGRTAL